MKKSAIVILLLFALGCYTKPIPKPSFQEQASCGLKKGQIGVFQEKNSLGEIQITKVFPNLPAARAGIKEGDIFIRINDIPIKEKDDVTNIVRSIKEETPIPVLLRRDGKEITLTVIPKIIYAPHIVWAIADILSRNEKINLVIVVNEIWLTIDTPNREEWKRATKNNIRSEEETSLIHSSQNIKHFSVLDREMTDRILREIELQQTGLVEGFKKASNLTGATHLLIMDFSRCPAPRPFSYLDVTTKRLVPKQASL